MMPIVSLLIVIAIFSIISFSISKLLGSKIWTITIVRWIVLGYIVLGLIALLILSFTTKGDERTSIEEMKEIFEDDLRVWNELRSGQANSIYEDYLKEEWQLELTSDQFTVKSYIEDPFEVAVVVERRDDPDSNIIHAKTYVIPYTYKGIDFTEKLSLDYFEFENDKLIVKLLPEQEIHFYRINPRMEILAQFRDENNYENESYYSFSTGKIILFLNVPSHVTIKDESGYIDYVQ